MSENEIIKKENLQITNHDFLIYRDANNDVKISVLLINNDIWLTYAVAFIKNFSLNL